MVAKAVVARFVAKDKGTREQLLELLRAAADNAFKNEPGLRRYAITTEAQSPISQGPPDELVVWMVEECVPLQRKMPNLSQADRLPRYADGDTYENHMQQAPIQQLGAWLAGGLDEAPKIWTLDVLEDSSFTKPEVTKHANPTVVFTELGYKPGTLRLTLPYWKAVADISKTESGTFVWGAALDPEDADKLAIIHVYENQEYLVKVHATSKEMQEVQNFTADLRTQLTPYFLKLVGGYLWK
ncbi:hypothetical protein F5884DRAFT_756251 [Xylogone sp. PMI_703]|nr:hypothetical protein F5884DRAFT_756251 [Xylogone sp. PMI_703]